MARTVGKTEDRLEIGIAGERSEPRKKKTLYLQARWKKAGPAVGGEYSWLNRSHGMQGRERRKTPPKKSHFENCKKTLKIRSGKKWVRKKRQKERC